ncbi:MAG: DUF1838 family protein [Rhodospirillaceae bacterium]|nr:DUF1838 family protein [Rhodospirillaceae bacterium]
MPHNYDLLFNRRNALGLGMAGAGASLAPLAAGLGFATPANATTLKSKTYDFTKPEDNFRATMKSWITTKPDEEVIVYFFGVESAVTDDGKKVIPICGRVGTDFYRVIPQADGSYRCLLNELVFYTDLGTGEVLNTWYNPMIEEEVEVFHLRQGPVNFTLSKDRWEMDFAAGRSERRWTIVDDHAFLNWHSDSSKKNPLDPKKWPRESTGEMTYRHEFMVTISSLAELENPEIGSVKARGMWGSIKDWLPWMLMGDKPGRIFTRMSSTKIDSAALLPRPVLDYAEKHYPEMLAAPKKWTDEYVTIYDHFERERKPKPPKSAGAGT